MNAKIKTNKILFVLTIALMLAVNTNRVEAGPTKVIRYQGEVFSGYTFGLGKTTDMWVYDRVPIHILNGVNFKESLFMGIGVGINAWTLGDNAIKDATVTIPVYMNFKWYLPGGDRFFKFFLGADMGGVIQDKAEMGALLISPMLGMRFRLVRRLGLTLSAAYTYEGWVDGYKNATSTMYNTHGVSVRAGITF